MKKKKKMKSHNGIFGSSYAVEIVAPNRNPTTKEYSNEIVKKNLIWNTGCSLNE